MDKVEKQRRELKKNERKQLEDFNFLFDSYFRIYFEITNIINLIENNYIWYCFCNHFQGCELDYNKGRKLCFLCLINIHCDTGDVEEIAHSPIKLFKYMTDLYEI